MAQGFIVLLFALIIHANADIEKLAPGIIRNGSDIYAFFRSRPGWFSIVFRDTIPATDTLIVFHLFKPDWANSGADIDSTPDINVLNNSHGVRLYYTAQKTLTERTVIGVGSSDQIYSEDFFKVQDHPLIESSNKNLSQPSLIQSSDNALWLFYYSYNASEELELGSVKMVKLGRNGLAVIGDEVEVLKADLEWEGGSVRTPSVIEYEGVFYILYTGADEDTVGVAKSSRPEGPYVKSLQPIGKICSIGKKIRDIRKSEFSWGQGWPYFK